MSDKEKLELIRKIIYDDYNWIDVYRKTFNIPDGISLPSGANGFETSWLLIKQVLEDKPVRL